MVRELRGCLYAISGFERTVLSLRAGLDRERGLSRRAVASRLDVPARRVRRAERRGLKQLRRASRSLGCQGAALQSEPSEVAELVVAATESQHRFARVNDLEREAVHASRRNSADSGAGGTLGRSEHSSGPSKQRARQGPALAAGTGDPAGGGAGAAFIAGIGAGVLMLAALLVFLLRRYRSPYPEARSAGPHQIDWSLWEAAPPVDDPPAAEPEPPAPEEEEGRPLGNGRVRTVGVVAGLASVVLGFVGSRLRRRR